MTMMMTMMITTGGSKKEEKNNLASLVCSHAGSFLKWPIIILRENWDIEKAFFFSDKTTCGFSQVLPTEFLFIIILTVVIIEGLGNKSQRIKLPLCFNWKSIRYQIYLYLMIKGT